MKKITITFFLSICLLFNSYSQDTNIVNQEKNLKMTMVFEKAGENVEYDVISLYLTNQSETDKYQIILPGDGSESAWREPYIYFTAQYKNEQNKWIQLEKYGSLRCGLFDAEWQDDTTTINPGRKIQIYKMASENITGFFNIPSSRKIRLTAHYDYKQGQHPKEHLNEIDSGYKEVMDQQAKIENIYGIPPFVLTSDWIEIDIK